MIEFFLTILYFLLFSIFIYRLKFFQDDIVSKYWIISLFGIKIAFSVLLTAIYTHYYTDRTTADIFKYFDDSKVMFDAIKSNPIDYLKMLLGIDNDSSYFTEKYYNNMLHWVRPYSSDIFSDSHIIIRFNAFVRLFSFGYFSVHNVFINFISLIGLFALYKSFKPFLPTKEKSLFYIIAFIPSVLFWGSGLLKEGIILFALGLFMLNYFNLLKEIKLVTLIIILFCITIILFTKFYLLVALFIPTTSIFLSNKLKIKTWMGYVFGVVLFIMFTYTLSFINEDWNIVFQIANKQQTFSRFITEVPTSSGFLIPELTDGLSIITNMPHALFNTFIRPLPNECNSTFVLLSFIENLLVIVLFVIGFLFRQQQTTVSKSIIVFNLFYVFCLYILIGLTTPVFGAIIRYKVPALPFLLIAVLLIVDLDKLKSRYSFLNKIL